MPERINLKQRLGLDNPSSEALIEQFQRQMDLAQELYDLRTERGLSQAAAATLAGTSPAVIESIEDSDCDIRRSRQILDRLPKALDQEPSASRTPAAAAGAV
jgi:transcriptional regulator with XRE-family HTH domain